MASAIDPTKPVDGVPASKADLRANLQAAKSEIEGLQTGKADVGHQHGLVDIIDAGALASRDTVAAVEIDDDAVTNAKLANMAAATFKGRAAGAGTGDPIDGLGSIDEIEGKSSASSLGLPGMASVLQSSAEVAAICQIPGGCRTRSVSRASS